MQGTNFTQLNLVQLPWNVNPGSHYSEMKLHVSMRKEGKRNIEVIACIGKFIRGCILQISPMQQLQNRL
jgi:N-acetyl-gamma-glutamylphosphate reductase